MSFAHAENRRELEEFAFLTFPDEPWLQIRNLEEFGCPTRLPLL